MEVLVMEHIEIKEEDCGKHKVASTTTKIVHSCPYCNKSLHDINVEMEAIYLKLNRGKINQSKAEADAEKIISACNTRDCPLNAKWKKGGNIRKKIERHHQNIKDYKK